MHGTWILVIINDASLPTNRFNIYICINYCLNTNTLRISASNSAKFLSQDRLHKLLPKHLAHMALVAVNTGCCDSEICNLCREWEQEVPELGTSALIIPGSEVKNGDNRLVVLIIIPVQSSRRDEGNTQRTPLPFGANRLITCQTVAGGVPV